MQTRPRGGEVVECACRAAHHLDTKIMRLGIECIVERAEDALRRRPPREPFEEFLHPTEACIIACEQRFGAFTPRSEGVVLRAKLLEKQGARPKAEVGGGGLCDCWPQQEAHVGAESATQPKDCLVKRGAIRGRREWVVCHMPGAPPEEDRAAAGPQ